MKIRQELGGEELNERSSHRQTFFKLSFSQLQKLGLKLR